MTDLEKAIELARKHEGLFGMRNREECLVAACQEMAEWKEKQMMEKAVSFLNENLMRTLLFDKHDKENFINNFKKAME